MNLRQFKTTPLLRKRAGFALLMVMALLAVCLIALAATYSRSNTVSKLNKRNTMYSACQAAAEAAVEKVVARMAYDFHTYGPGTVTNNLGLYRTYYPSEDSYLSGFAYSDGISGSNAVLVQYLSNYSGALPSQFPGLSTSNSPVYAITSYASASNSGDTVRAGVEEDMMLALVPLPQWAIFANGLLEFSTCATLTVNGRVHANGPIYVGAASGSTLTFNSTVTSTATISAPNNNGQSWGTDPSTWRTTFNGTPTYSTNVASVNLNISMTNSHSLIEIPPTGESPTSVSGEQRLYNQAEVVILVSNNVVITKIQNGSPPGNDGSPIVITNSFSSLTNLPFLTVSNSFADNREGKMAQATQIDIGQYGSWIATNASVLSKFPSGSGTYPTLLYVADCRPATSSQLDVVRLSNAGTIPSNGGAGFSVGSPNPLYVLGNYNCPTANLATTNTTGSVPSALMCDALTVLSANWSDTLNSTVGGVPLPAASADTINAAIMAGLVPSTGSSSTTYSGGIHNMPRLLENWSGCNLWLNTAMLYLYASKSATNHFINPSTYYSPPTRKFTYDSYNFSNPNRQPPGMPDALVAVRVAFAAH